MLLRRAAALATATVLAIALSACTSESAEEADASGTSGDAPAAFEYDTSAELDLPEVSVSEEARELLPAEVLDSGTLAVGVVINKDSTPPTEFYADDAKTATGFYPQNARLIAEALGLEYDELIVSWDDWPLALEGGKFDVVSSGVSITDERKEKYDFSTTLKSDFAFLAKAGSGLKIDEPADIAGLTIANKPGNSTEPILAAWNEENIAAGLEPAEIVSTSDSEDLSLQSGQIDLIAKNAPTLTYKAGIAPDKFELAGTFPDNWPNQGYIGLATVRDSGLIEAINAAQNHLIETGVYEELAAKWNLSGQAIDEAIVNPPTGEE